jgi:hypothetical protein
MALLEVLDRHGVQYDKPEAEARLALLMKGLRRDPTFAKELETFKKQKGGADPSTSMEIPIPVKMTEGDFLGSELRWFVDVMGSPYAQVVVRILFTVLFFLSYVENIPVVGSILSAVLDVTLAGGRILIKTIQKALPPMFGLIPLPFMGIVGIVVASAFGMILWPVLAIIAFSRQDFTSAIESFVRVIPPPMGDALADAFLDANRTVYKLNDKRKKLTEDVVNGLQSIMSLGDSLGSKVTEGAQTLASQLKSLPTVPNVAQLKSSLPTVPNVAQLKSSLPTVPNVAQLKSSLPTIPSVQLPATGARRDRLSRKKRTQTKWKTSRQRIRSARRSGSGLR